MYYAPCTMHYTLHWDLTVYRTGSPKYLVAVVNTRICTRWSRPGRPPTISSRSFSLVVLVVKCIPIHAPGHDAFYISASEPTLFFFFKFRATFSATSRMGIMAESDVVSPTKSFLFAPWTEMGGWVTPCMVSTCYSSVQRRERKKGN